jgi:hypothetical protein
MNFNSHSFRWLVCVQQYANFQGRTALKERQISAFKLNCFFLAGAKVLMTMMMTELHEKKKESLKFPFSRRASERASKREGARRAREKKAEFNHAVQLAKV